MTVTFRDGRELRLLNPAAATEKFREIELPSGDGAGHLFAVTLNVTNLAATRSYLNLEGSVSFRALKGASASRPQSACGVLLEFIQAERS